MKRIFIVVLFAVALLCGACSNNRCVVRTVKIASVDWGDAMPTEGAIPKQVMLGVELQNMGSGILVRDGRLRLSYNGQRVMMLSLEERVTIPRRFEGEIFLPLKVSVARNSQTMALRSALMQHKVEGVSVNWDITGKKGLMRSHIVQTEEMLSEIASEEMLEALWHVTDAILDIKTEM